MKVRLNDIRIFCRHGVMDDERTLGAWFRVNLCATTPDERATFTDGLSHTLNYAQMADIVKEEMQLPSQLIEHVAGRIGRRIMHEMAAIERLDVTVIKEHPPVSMECESAAIELTFSRTDEA